MTPFTAICLYGSLSRMALTNVGHFISPSYPIPVEECTKADTGVGAAIAAGSQDEKGI